MSMIRIANGVAINPRKIVSVITQDQGVLIQTEDREYKINADFERILREIKWHNGAMSNQFFGG